MRRAYTKILIFSIELKITIFDSRSLRLQNSSYGIPVKRTAFHSEQTKKSVVSCHYLLINEQLNYADLLDIYHYIIKIYDECLFEIER